MPLPATGVPDPARVQVLESDSSNTKALFRKATALMGLKEHSDAEACVKAALLVAPGDADLLMLQVSSWQLGASCTCGQGAGETKGGRKGSAARCAGGCLACWGRAAAGGELHLWSGSR